MKIRIATPILAVIASCRMASMFTSINTAKPTASQTNAVKPAMNRRRKVLRAASTRFMPRPISCMTPFIFCAPWLMPMAKIRNGTRIE
ncbi:hypothetical protein D9M69_634910 [compost metagenome]